MPKTKNINGLPIERFVDLDVQDDGKIVILVGLPGGEEFGLLLEPNIVDELTGALIERPGSGYANLGSDDGNEQDVADHAFEQIEPDAYTLQLTGEQGTKLTFRMGSRRVRRIRDTMTAHLVRHERKHGMQ
ncbi:MAG: hypothetical protein H6884_09880 [Rhodobiaceae bacterium]|nr:hypothetical protein [bacterium]MCC0054356.1 hypothetical protein [Rhodobiaceae bacterium]